MTTMMILACIAILAMSDPTAAASPVAPLSQQPSIFAESLPEGATRHIFRHKGMEREYILYRPAGLKENAPLVLVLHGYGGRAMKSGAGMNRIADREGFAVCYPQGAVDGRGKTCWNVGYPFQKGLKTDDVDFLMKLATRLCRDNGFDRRNIFLTGMSNGGEMCYLMAYTHPEFFNAIAPIAGLTMEWMRKELKAKGPVPIMEVHGTQDHTSEWKGDPDNAGGWGAYISVPLAIGRWADEARCTHVESTELVQEPAVVQSDRKPNKVILHRYLGGVPAYDGGPEIEVRLYEVQDGGHSWSDRDMDTYQEIWNFFSKYLR